MSTGLLITDHAFVRSHVANRAMCAAMIHDAASFVGKRMCGAPLAAHQHGLLGADARAETICTCAAGDSSPGTDHSAMCALWQPRLPPLSTDIDFLRDISERLGEILTAINRLTAAVTVQASGGTSSVQLEQGAKETRLTVKAYSGDLPLLSDTGNTAVREFGRLRREVERQQMTDWHDTLSEMQGGA